MAKTFGPRYFQPSEINFKNHWAEGTQWQIIGSRGDEYTVELTRHGFTCDCVGMKMHGKCKHTREIAERFIQ